MSGHSHWAGIKQKKEIADRKRGQVFSKLSKEIEVAVRQGGKDPNFNPRLRLAIERAKDVRMPNENIERAIKRGAGELGGEKLEDLLLEAYGPGKTAIIIEAITNNKNRTLNQIKQILLQNRGKLVTEGAVKWMFERKGCITVKSKPETKEGKQISKEELELLAIEAGAQDLSWNNNLLDIYTKPEDLEKVKESLEKTGLKIESSSLDWVPKEEISPSPETRKACQKLFEALDENDDVQEIYSNLKPESSHN